MEVNKILGKLRPFENKTVLVSNYQDSADIIKQIMKAHTKYASEYDKISSYFWKGSVKNTCKYIFDFLKKKVEYDIEPDTKQTVKSPSAIIAQGYGDCKHYSLFTAGILDSLRRSGKPINWSYRFANYKLFSRTPHHVFVVVDPHTNNEIWCDAVLEFFNNHKPYVNATDKNYKQMALYSISGVGKTNFRQMNLNRIWKYLKFYRAKGFNNPASPYYKRYLLLVKKYNFYKYGNKFAGFNQELNLQSVAGIGCNDCKSSVGYTAAQRQTDLNNLWRKMQEYKRNGWNNPASPYFNEYFLARKEYLRVRSLSTMNGYTGTTSIEGIGRRSKSERKARRSARREARRSGPNCKGRLAAKVGLAVPRKAFLLLVRLNVRKLGVKIYKGLQNPTIAPKIYSKWCGLGGNASLLRSTATKAYMKAKRRGKVSGDVEGIGVAIETVIATASAILAAMEPVLKMIKGGGAEETTTTEQQ